MSRVAEITTGAEEQFGLNYHAAKTVRQSETESASGPIVR